MLELPPLAIRVTAMACHLFGLAGWAIAMVVTFPFSSVLLPLLLWLMNRDRDPLIDHHGKAAIDFQASLLFYRILEIGLLAAITITVQGGFPESVEPLLNQSELSLVNGLQIVDTIFLMALFLWQGVLVTTATLKAYRGELYSYPFTLGIFRQDAIETNQSEEEE